MKIDIRIRRNAVHLRQTVNVLDVSQQTQINEENSAQQFGENVLKTNSVLLHLRHEI